VFSSVIVSPSLRGQKYILYFPFRVGGDAMDFQAVFSAVVIDIFQKWRDLVIAFGMQFDLLMSEIVYTSIFNVQPFL